MRIQITQDSTETLSTGSRPAIQNLGPGTLRIAKESSDTLGVEIPSGGIYEFPRSLSETDGDNTLHLTATGDAVEVRWIEV